MDRFNDNVPPASQVGHDTICTHACVQAAGETLSSQEQYMVALSVSPSDAWIKAAFQLMIMHDATRPRAYFPTPLLLHIVSENILSQTWAQLPGLRNYRYFFTDAPLLSQQCAQQTCSEHMSSFLVGNPLKADDADACLHLGDTQYWGAVCTLKQLSLVNGERVGPHACGNIFQPAAALQGVITARKSTTRRA